MAEILIGVVIMACFWGVVSATRKKQLRVPIWGWFLTIIGFGYVVFIAMTLLAFCREEQYQALLPVGGMMVFPGLVLAVFLYRFAFMRAAKTFKAKTGE